MQEQYIKKIICETQKLDMKELKEDVIKYSDLYQYKIAEKL